MRRLVAALVLVCSSFVAFSAPATIHAANIALEPELIARKLATQTTGPSGFLSPNDVMPWGLDRIDSRIGRDNTFTYSTDGTGVKAYVIDSGVSATHLEFSGRVLPGWSYRSRTSDPTGTALTSYNYAIAAYGSNPTLGLKPCAYKPEVHQFDPSTFDGVRDDSDIGQVDNDGHGTHVAGTIGGTLTGVAKAVSIVPVRVLDSCGQGTSTMVLNGLNWILDNHQQGERAVVNMSIGFESPAKPIDAVIKSLLSEGVVIVAASGNESKSACGKTPAGTEGTISVGASMSNDGEPLFTNFGSCVDIYAPGQSVISSWPKYLSAINTYAGETGTSMAAPHVTGAVARYLQSATVTSTTPTEAWNWLKKNATCNAITYYKSSETDISRASLVKTPNRLLAVEAPATVPCAPGNITATVADKSSVITWDEVVAGNGADVTAYTATATPGGMTCSVASGTSCTIAGLTNNTNYSISVAATNSVGVGTASSGVSVIPVGPPSAITGLNVAPQLKALDVSWVQAVGDGAGITYTATATPGGATCSSTETSINSCKITGLVNGTQYTVSVVGTNTFGTSSETKIEKSVRPGFTVKKSQVKKGSKSSLSWLISSLSTGKKTWSETGPCSIVGTKLKAPKSSGSCVVRLKVAKTAKFPAMSTKLRVAVE
jgi:subtilisin family serine protease